MPDFALEMSSPGVVCGIDEAGRGPLAGPVVAAAVILERRRLPKALRHGLDDSKKLSLEEREEYWELLDRCVRDGAAKVGIGAASVIEIDRRNILQATLAAMGRAVAALGLIPDIALVDGNVPPKLPCRVKTVIGGDGLSLSIAAASIIAKVTRDRLMPARHALRGIWVAHERWLRHGGASGGVEGAGPHPASPPLLRAGPALARIRVE